MDNTILAVFISALLLYLSTRFFPLFRHVKYPPGPRPRLLVGNMFDFPKEHAHLHYVEWGKKFGSDILHASSFGNHVLILNSQEDADELLERRSNIYSNRPGQDMLKFIGWDCNLSMMNQGKEWQAHRKLAHQYLRPDAAKVQNPTVLRKVHQMLRGLLDSPDNFEEHNKMLSISIPMATMYGINVESLNDPYISAADSNIAIACDLLQPGYSVLEILPFLRYVPPWFPWATTQKRAEIARRLTKHLKDTPMNFVKKSLSEGRTSSALVPDYLLRKAAEDGSISEEEEDVLSNVAYTMYGGASDTTAIVTSTFIYLMATHPEVQKKAQAEIDQVIGLDRLPNPDDRAFLPYTDAIYREVLRWRPTPLLSLPHVVTEDDYYKGYFIPKGTIVLPNVWAMTRNEAAYPNPSLFEPERFLDKSGQLNGDDRVLAYGFGRRVCVGKYVASSTMWIMIASMLSIFDLGKARDEHGNEIEINGEYEGNNLQSRKKPFKCSIVPRSDHAKRLIEEGMIMASSRRRAIRPGDLIIP